MSGETFYKATAAGGQAFAGRGVWKPVDVAVRGGRRCQTCGRVHDALWWKPDDPSAGYSWGAPGDRHPYKPEAWEQVAARYGWSPEAERERFGVAGG